LWEYRSTAAPASGSAVALRAHYGSAERLADCYSVFATQQRASDAHIAVLRRNPDSRTIAADGDRFAD
jgi:hypothetical protein